MSFEDQDSKHDRKQERRKSSDKRKFHKRGFHEGVEDQRSTRVNFKKYLREVEENSILDDMLYDDDLES